MRHSATEYGAQSIKWPDGRFLQRQRLILHHVQKYDREISWS